MTLCPSSVIQDDDPVLLVDQNVWLVRREVMLECPMPGDFTEEDVQNNAGPDDKVLELLMKNGVPIISSGLPPGRRGVHEDDLHAVLRVLRVSA